MYYKEIELGQNQEYRIEVPASKKLRIMVVAGIAEVRGQELLSERWYVFTNICVSIFTFTGAKMRVDGQCDLQYTARNAMSPGIFRYFSRIRNEGGQGVRRIAVVGQGRTTFCATLINYFVRMHRRVIFMEVDPARGNIFPGAIGAMPIETLVDYADHFRLNNPLCLFYGSTEIENTELYDLQIDALKKAVAEQEKLKEGAEMSTVDTADAKMPCFQVILAPNVDAAMLNNLVKRLEVDEVVYVGDERLYNRSECVVPKVFIENYGYIQEAAQIPFSFKKYFHGTNNEYTSCTFTVKHDWKIVRVGEEHAAPDSALPLGGTRHVGKTSVNPTELSENSILAISEAEKEEDVATALVVGFIVCLDDQRFKVLCTQSHLPKHTFLVQGNIKYADY